MAVQGVLCSLSRPLQPSCTTSRTLSSMMRYLYPHTTHNQSFIAIIDIVKSLIISRERQICCATYAQSQKVTSLKAECFEVNVVSHLLLCCLSTFQSSVEKRFAGLFFFFHFRFPEQSSLRIRETNPRNLCFFFLAFR